MKTLIVIDMQNDFIDGVLGTKEAQAIVPNVVNKINEGWDRIVYTMDTHNEFYKNTIEGKHIPEHCIKGTQGHLLHPDIYNAIKEVAKTTPVRHVEKDSFGSIETFKAVEAVCTVGGPGFVGVHPLTEITVVGLCTDICVISNVLLLNSMFNLPIKVDSKCCAGTTIENHKAALQIMKNNLIEVINE